MNKEDKEKIEQAILTLDVLIDCNKEDGTHYNAIKEWEALEVFKKLYKRIDKAIKYINDNVAVYAFNNKDLPHWEFNDDDIKELLEILRGKDENN